MGDNIANQSVHGLSGGTIYSFPYQSGVGSTAFLPASTAGSLLTTNSTTGVPTWTAPSALSVGTATNTNNIYVTQNSTNADYQIPILSTTHTGAGYYPLKVDGTTTIFTYNTNTHTLKPTNISLSGTLADATISVGTSGQVLSSTATGTSWITPSISTLTTTATSTNTNYYLPLITSTSTGSQSYYTDAAGNLTYNPSTDTLTVPNSKVNTIVPQTASSGVTVTTTGANTGLANSSYPITLTNTDTDGALTSYSSTLKVRSTAFGSSGFGGAVQMSATKTVFGSSGSTILGVDDDGVKITSTGLPYLYGYVGSSPSSIYIAQSLTVSNSIGVPTILGQNAGINSPINFPMGILYNQFGVFTTSSGTTTLLNSYLYANCIFTGNGSFIVKLPSTAGLEYGSWIGITFAPGVAARVMTIQNFSGGGLTTLTSVANAAGAPSTTCRLMLLNNGNWYCV